MPDQSGCHLTCQLLAVLGVPADIIMGGLGLTAIVSVLFGRFHKLRGDFWRDVSLRPPAPASNVNPPITPTTFSLPSIRPPREGREAIERAMHPSLAPISLDDGHGVSLDPTPEDESLDSPTAGHRPAGS